FVLTLLALYLNDPPTTEIYTLSLHDALPISCSDNSGVDRLPRGHSGRDPGTGTGAAGAQDRVHQLAADSRADARLRRGRIHVQERVSGLSGRGSETKAAIRLGRPDVRKAVHRPLVQREAGQAE